MSSAPPSRRPRVLLLTISLNPPGGGQGVAAWMLEALRRDHELTTLTLDPPRFEEIDSYYGTELAGAGVRTLVHTGSGLHLPGLRLALLRKCLLFRHARRVAPGFDVVISNENETDVGVSCIQYVHFPWSYRERPEAELRWFHRLPGALPAYRAACGRLGGYRPGSATRNTTLANSRWTATRLERALPGTEVHILEPPVLDPGSGRPWSERRRDFLVIGRLAPEKRIEDALAILERVRARGHDTRLELIGSIDHRRYSRRLFERLAARSAWVTFHRDLPRTEVDRAIGASRYGLHCMVDEHFGMAVAEMIRGGCVVFAHRSGGPAEILRHDALLFESRDHAADAICAVLEDPDLEEGLRRHLAERARQHSLGRFVERLREHVRQQLREGREARDRPGARLND